MSWLYLRMIVRDDSHYAAFVLLVEYKFGFRTRDLVMRRHSRGSCHEFFIWQKIEFLFEKACLSNVFDHLGPQPIAAHIKKNVSPLNLARLSFPKQGSHVENPQVAPKSFFFSTELPPKGIRLHKFNRKDSTLCNQALCVVIATCKIEGFIALPLFF